MKPAIYLLSILFCISIAAKSQNNNLTDNYFIGSGAQISVANDNVRGTRYGAVLISEQQIGKKSSYFIAGSMVIPKKYKFETPIKTENAYGFDTTILYQALLTNMYFTVGLGYKQFLVGNFKNKDGVYIAASLGLAVSIDKLDIDYDNGYGYEYNALFDLYENTAAALFAGELAIGYSKKVNDLEFFSELKYQYFTDPTREKSPYIPSNHQDSFKFFQINNQRISNSYAITVGIKYAFQ